MNTHQGRKTLHQWDQRGRYVFTRRQLARLFPEDSTRAFAKGLDRMVHSNLLVRACRGVYVNPTAHSLDRHVIERIAIALRSGEYNYLSLESALAEYGAISQIPLDRITVMTTGRKGVYETPYGVIEFTHTSRPLTDILAHVRRDDERPLRIAMKATAWRDLKRSGRNTHLVSTVELDADE